MKIKTFHARNFREALSVVKKDLGPDAVILSSEDRKRDGVEVIAAIDFEPDAHAAGQCSVSEPQPVSSDFAILKQEIKSLRGYLESMKNSGFALKIPDDRKQIYTFLREQSICEEFAVRLIERVRDRDELANQMTDDMNILRPGRKNGLVPRSPLAGKRLVMLIGPTGAGKTTTIAKLATNAIREGKKAALISLDTYKIGAAEQIRIYSRMIGIPLEIVTGNEHMKKSIARFSDREIIFIDTSGQNPRNEEYISSLKSLYETGLPIETQLLLSTSSDCDFLMSTQPYYEALPVDYIAFTKVDEAVRLGSMYNLSQVFQRPVAYITTGQGVPGNIEFLDSRKLTGLILNAGRA